MSDPILLIGDCRETLKTLPDASVNCCVTSPPYFGLRDYGTDGQIGLEQTPDDYVAEMVSVFREVRRVLRDDGTVWLNLGDSYASGIKGSGGGWAADPKNYAHKAQAYGARKYETGGLANKQLIGIPWRVAFALQADGWYLRQDIIWHKPNPMPESVVDRCTKSHEYLFLLTKSARYWYDAEAVKEAAQCEPHAPGWTGRTADNSASMGSYRPTADGGSCSQYAEPGRVWAQDGKRNRRSVWTVATQPFSGAMLMADYVGADGKPYTVSPDCPIHGRRHGSGSQKKTGRDEQQGQTANRTADTSIGHGQARQHGSPSIPCPVSRGCETSSSALHTLENTTGNKTDDSLQGAEGLQNHPSNVRTSEIPACNSDCLHPGNFPTAIDHSKQTSKTARDPLTNQPCTPCAENRNDKPDTSTERESSGPRPDKRESTGREFDLGDSRLTETLSRSDDKQSLSSCSWDKGNTAKCTCQQVKIDHFATFPPKLIEPCIMAGCPSKVCAVCGAPWERVVEKTGGTWEQRKAAGAPIRDGVETCKGTPMNRKGESQSRTIGHRPTCDCDPCDPDNNVPFHVSYAPTVPGTVLDPFSGAGTTGLVAIQQGRQYIGCEMNPEYAALSRERWRLELAQPKLELGV
jgi:DNA modification methylase